MIGLGQYVSASATDCWHSTWNLLKRRHVRESRCPDRKDTYVVSQTSLMTFNRCAFGGIRNQRSRQKCGQDRNIVQLGYYQDTLHVFLLRRSACLYALVQPWGWMLVRGQRLTTRTTNYCSLDSQYRRLTVSVSCFSSAWLPSKHFGTSQSTLVLVLDSKEGEVWSLDQISAGISGSDNHQVQLLGRL